MKQEYYSLGWRIISSIALLIFFQMLFAGGSFCQNRTVGDNVGEDNTAFVFAPFRYNYDRGEDNYILHVGDFDTTYGQQYEVIDFRGASPPDTSMPAYCNLVNFYEIITSKTDELGIFLITGHGNTSNMAVEVYEQGAIGDSVCLEQAYRYYYGTVDPAVPPLRWGTDFGPTWTGDSTPVIAVTDRLIRESGDLNKGLVYVGTCYGGHLADDFVLGNARFAMGNDTTVFPFEQYIRITKFFERMDGYGFDGQFDRRADSAVGDLDTCLIWDGSPNTTLSPCVDSVHATAPLEIGDSIVIKMETNCDTTGQPDIRGLHCLIENEYWLDSLTMVGFCTEVPHPKAYAFGIDLEWSEVFSANNLSALDGNIDPIGPEIYNAKGPSLDNYTRLFVDSSDWKYFVNLTGYRPANNPIWTDWQKIHPDTFEMWEIDDWYDDGDYILSEDDTIQIIEQASQKTSTELVDLVTPFMKVTIYKTEVYLEMIENNPLITDWPFPIGTYWVEISPDYTKAYQIIDWTDYDGSGDLNYFDYIGLYVLNGPDSGQSHACQVEEYMTGILTSPICYGLCGDANADGTVNSSDAVYLINYTFMGGPAPLPVLACGDANSDGTSNVSDAVYIINYVFVSGNPPGDCMPGSPNWIDGDCCPFTP